KTGDGAGLLLPLPQALLPAAGCGLAMVFLREDGDREAIEEACRAEGLEPVGWRVVPVDAEALGAGARASAPRIEQLVLAPARDLSEEEAELRAYRARRRAEPAIRSYVASLSF